MSRKIPPDAFDYYLSLGVARNYRLVAERYKVSKRAVTYLALKEKWQERSEALERKAREASEKKQLESLEAMNDRHLLASRLIQAKAIEALRTMQLEGALDAVKALDLGMRQERLIRGEPTDRAAVSIEEVIRKEHERWMIRKEQAHVA